MSNNAHIAELKRKIAENEYKASRSLIKESTEVKPKGFDVTVALKEHAANTKVTLENKKKMSSNIKLGLLTETLFRLYKKALVIEGFVEDIDGRIMYNYINNFINESGGIDKMMSIMETASEYTSNIALNINKEHDRLLEAAKKENEKEYNKGTFEIKYDEDKFFSMIDDKNTEDIIDEIKARVGESIDTFIEKNKEDKEEIENVYKTAKEKMEALDSENASDAVAESYGMIATRKASMITEGKSKNIFEAMVTNLSKGVLKNEQLRESFSTEDSNLDIGKIIESAKVMYTFLETVNTLGIQKVNSKYLATMLDEIC